MSKSILVIAAHPDDEVIGCGGYIAREAEKGSEVNIIIVSEGATSRDLTKNKNEFIHELSELSSSAKRSAEILGVSNIELLDFPDNKLDSIDRLVLIKKIEEKIKFYKPYEVLTHHYGDLNIDHRRIHEAVLTATRPIPSNFVKKLLSFEVSSSTDYQINTSSLIFKPNYFVDISSTIKKKLDALREYKSEMRDWPHTRSIKAIEALSITRGSQVGVKYAEAFSLLRFVE